MYTKNYYSDLTYSSVYVVGLGDSYKDGFIVNILIKNRK